MNSEAKLILAVGLSAGGAALLTEWLAINGRFARPAFEAGATIALTYVLRRKVGFFHG